MALVELENVAKSYGPVHALGPLSLTLPEGTVGLLGPNGAGKSTLLRILLGILPPDEGTVRVLGEPVGPGAVAIRRRIGYVPEGETVFPGLTGIEAVAFAGRLVGMRRVDAIERAHRVLDYVELGEARYLFVEKYSTGMRQRLKLAQALVHDPEFLILDEPTEGVDPEARIHILDLMRELSREHGLKMIVSTHILPDVERIATHALVLNHGKAVALDTVENLKKARAGGYVVRVHGDLGAFAAHLASANVKHEVQAPAVRVETDDPRAILAHARAAGVAIRQLTPFTLTLEEAFEEALSKPAGGA